MSIGQSPLLNSSRIEDHFQLVDTVTLVRGDHQFGFGASVQHVSPSMPAWRIVLLVYSYSPHSTHFRPVRRICIQAFGDPHARYATNPIASWLQDQWRPAAGVTVIGGVRYEAQMLPARRSAL